MKSGYGLMFFFGGIDILSRMLEKEIEASNKESKGVGEIEEVISRIRTKVMKEFTKINELRNVSDLFVKPPPLIDFNPICFDMRIPLSLQKIKYVLSESTRGEVEEFKLVYDGIILLVAAYCPLDRRPWGVYDARDKFIEILNSIFNFRKISPCLTHEAIIFVNKGEKTPKKTRDIYIEVEPCVEYLEITRSLYLKLGLDMHLFYDACAVAQNVNELVFRRYILESELLSDLSNFLKSNWWQILRRKKYAKQGKEKMLEILKIISEYSSLSEDLNRSRQEIEESIAHNSLFRAFMQQVNLEEYCKPDEPLDIASLMRLIEHFRKELEIYSVSTSTILSALLGALIGSILTMIASYCLGVFP